MPPSFCPGSQPLPPLMSTGPRLSARTDKHGRRSQQHKEGTRRTSIQDSWWMICDQRREEKKGAGRWLLLAVDVDLIWMVVGLFIVLRTMLEFTRLPSKVKELYCCIFKSPTPSQKRDYLLPKEVRL